MKIVTGLFHSYQAAKQALNTLERHRFSHKEGVTLIDPSKVFMTRLMNKQQAPSTSASSG
jgi:hypothetical protein